MTTQTGQRGLSSGARSRSSDAGRSPPCPGVGYSTISDMLATLIDTRDVLLLSRFSKTESCIKEIILHIGTPSIVTPLVDFLMQLQCAKLWCISDRKIASHDLMDRIERPEMALEFCSDAGVLNSQVGPHFATNSRAMAGLLDGMMMV